MRKIALSKKYIFKIASYRNYKELQKIAAVGPGVIVGGPHSGLMLPPSTRPEDNPEEEGADEKPWSPLDSYFSPSIQPERPPERRIINEERENLEQMGVEQLQEEAPAISSQEPVSFEEAQEEREELDPEYWRNKWEKTKKWAKPGDSVEEYIKRNIELSNDFYQIEPMSKKEFDDRYKEEQEVWEERKKSLIEKGLEPPFSWERGFDPIYMLMHESAGRMNRAYEEDNRPPALGRMTRLIADKEYGKIRTHFNRLWIDLIQWHRDAGSVMGARVSHNFRTIDTIVRNL